jgi:hypothetical protein
MLPYKLYVADNDVADTNNLQWRLVMECESAIALYVIVTELLPLVWEGEKHFYIEAPDGEDVITSLPVDEIQQKGELVA